MVVFQSRQPLHVGNAWSMPLPTPVPWIHDIATKRSARSVENYGWCRAVTCTLNP